MSFHYNSFCVALLIIQQIASIYKTAKPLSFNREVTFGSDYGSQSSTQLKKFKKAGFEISKPISYKNLKLGQVDPVECDSNSPHFAKFFGIEVAALGYDTEDPSKTVQTTGNCFSNTTISHSWLSDNQLQISFEVHKKISLLCTEHYFLTTLINSDIVTIYLEGTF